MMHLDSGDDFTVKEKKNRIRCGFPPEISVTGAVFPTTQRKRRKKKMEKKFRQVPIFQGLNLNDRV